MFYGCTNIPEPRYIIPNLTFDQVALAIQNEEIFGLFAEEPIEVQCSDKTMLATFDVGEFAWILTEK
jgi:hypothetical protein